MSRTRRPWLISLRIVAALLGLAGLGACHWLGSMAWASTGIVVVLGMSFGSAALLAATRGLGAQRGAVLGCVVGAGLAIGAGLEAGAPIHSAAVFALITTVMLGVAGRISGGFETPALGTSAARPMGPTALNANPIASAPVGEPEPPAAADLTPVDALLQSVSRFIQRDGSYRRGATAPTWEEFAHFACSQLTELFGASKTAMFHVSDDGEHLLPMLADEISSGHLPSARTGRTGHAVASGELWVDGRWQHGRGPRTAEASEAGWCWMVPLRNQTRTVALLTVSEFAATSPGPWVAHVIRDQFQLLWNAVSALQLIAFAERTHSGATLVGRNELFTLLDRAVRESQLAEETLTLLVVTIENMRRLDDVGLWPERDAVLHAVGNVLRGQVGNDHAIGRFSDDTFAVVLRRLDPAASQSLAERVVDALQEEASGVLARCMAGRAADARVRDLRITIRGGLSGAQFDEVLEWQPYGDSGAAEREASAALAGVRILTTAGQDMLRRAIGLLHYARRMDWDFASDNQPEIPAELRRGPR